MSKFNKDIIDEYANKLLIGLTDEENKMVLDEFEIIEKNMNLISQFPNINEVKPMTHTLDNFTYTLSDDKPDKSPEIEELLQNCDKHEGREIEVPKVVG